MRALVAFTSLPVEGKVKAKLAAEVGQEPACKLHRACAEHTLLSISLIQDVKRFLFYGTDSPKEQVDDWLRSIKLEGFELHAQADCPDLGGRMHEAFSNVFGKGAKQVVLIDMDVPDLQAELVQHAFSALDSNQDLNNGNISFAIHDGYEGPKLLQAIRKVVFGPATNGGYYLVGLTSPEVTLFQWPCTDGADDGPTICESHSQDIPWGTDKALQLSLEKAKKRGLKVAPLEALPRLADMNTYESVENWIALPESLENPLFGLSITILEETKFIREALTGDGAGSMHHEEFDLDDHPSQDGSSSATHHHDDSEDVTHDDVAKILGAASATK